ncbi:MAG: glycosyltransferase family 39 protein [Candidatus Omnitrophota bacterium]
MRKKWPFYLMPAFAVYLLSLLLVSPLYEFPIGDAWVYAKVAKHFYETGQFLILPWYGQSLLVQIGWAYLFLLPFGFSFSALNLSSVAMGVLAILFFNCLMKTLHFRRGERLWGCLLFVISPPFIHLSHSFHTDLSFLALYLAAAWMILEALPRRSGAWLLAGNVLLGSALLVRQVGIFLPLVLLFVLHRERHRWKLWQRLIPLIPFLMLGAFTLWQRAYFQRTPPANLLLLAYALRTDKILLDCLRIPFFLLLYFGYYGSPLLVFCATSLVRKRKIYPSLWRLFLLSWFALGTVILFVGFRRGVWMPDYLPRGFQLLGAEFYPHFLVTLSGMTGGALLFAVYYQHLFKRLDRVHLKWIWGICFGTLLVLLLPPVRKGLLSLGSVLLPPCYAFFSERIHLYQGLCAWQAQLPLLYRNALFGFAGLVFAGGVFLFGIPFVVALPDRQPPLHPMGKAEKIFHAASFLYLVLLLLLPVTTDRYFFPVFPSAILLVLRVSRAIPYQKVGASLFVLCVLVPALLHTDRLIQRVGGLWEGGEWLLHRGIAAEQIDGGFVFNGWHLYEKRLREGFEGTDRGWRKTGWWVTDGLYRVREAPPEGGYEVVHQFPFRDLLTPEEDFIYVSRRK